MYPTLKEGQIIFAHQVRRFRPGQVVVAYMGNREVVKRISKIKNSKVFLIGDNPSNSTDSRHHGLINDVDIQGIVFWPRNVRLK